MTDEEPQTRELELSDKDLRMIEHGLGKLDLEDCDMGRVEELQKTLFAERVNHE